MAPSRSLVSRIVPADPGRPYLILVAAMLAGGVALAVSGNGDLADLVWLAASVAGIVPVSVSVVVGLFHRRAGVDVIALLAIAGAVALGEYLAGAVISLMLATGLALEEYAVARSRREITALLQRAPREVHRYADGSVVTVAPDDVRPGDLILVMPGEVVPVDGIVVSETAVLDESAMTGEAQPVQRGAGEQVPSGVVNGGMAFDLRATTPAAESTYAGIVRLVDEAQQSKAPFSRMADRYALLFVPATLLVAAVAWLISGDPVRALAVLVVATPCPLILAVPVALVSGMSHAARRGIIIKGGGALETLARAKILLFDKTGTLTLGRPEVAEVEAASPGEADEVLRLAASLEQLSPHVLAASLVRAARKRGIALSMPLDVIEETGMGARGRVGQHTVAVGRLEWVSRDGAPPDWARRLRRRAAFEGFASTFVSIDGRVAGAMTLEDPIRPDTSRTLRTIRKAGVKRIVMVTGDRADLAESVGAVVGTDAVFAERTPAEKVAVVREEKLNGTTVMVGDGINDAPALAAADLGVAMGARGATASSEAADVVLLVDRLDRLGHGISIARRARTIAVQSVVAGMSLSLVGMGFAAAGYLAPVAGALLQEGIDAAVILNALRALSGYRDGTVRAGPAVEMARRFQSEHTELLPIVTDIRRIADRLETGATPDVLPDLHNLHRRLVEDLLPHEDAEEKMFYPEVAALLGGEDPTGTMSRAHVEIAHSIRLLGVLLDEIGEDGSDVADVVDLRRVLYGLHAILRLHFAQEEEAYLSLAEVRDEEVEKHPAPVS